MKRMISDKHWLKMVLVQTMIIYEETKDPKLKEAIVNWEPEIWLQYGPAPFEFKDLPNYIAAQEIRNSQLYKEMQEEEDGTEFDSEEEEE